MKIYIEIVFLLNFLLDFMILYGTKRLLKINKSIYRIILGSLIGMMITFIINIKINSFELFFVKIIFSFIMISTSFGFRNILKNMFYFYLISIILGGFLYLFNINSSFYTNIVLLIIISPIVIYFTIYELIKHKLDICNKYFVTIFYRNKKYKLEGFIDTGNKLKSNYSSKSVILVNLSIPYKRVIFVPYKAINKEGIIPCIMPDKIIINNKEINNCLVGLVKDKFNIGDCNCILPNKLREELC